MRYITLAIAFLIGISAEAQVIRAEPFYTAPEAAAVVTNLLLDSFPGAIVAYSVRKLDKDYTGSAIRVRRSNDNTEQDIGFVNNYLDTASMKTFVGANNGFVVTWYNQADSSGVFGIKNLTNTNAANQPQIIASGAVVYDGNQVAIDFDGTNDNLQCRYVNGNIFFLNHSVFSVHNWTGGGGGTDGRRFIVETTVSSGSEIYNPSLSYQAGASPKAINYVTGGGVTDNALLSTSSTFNSNTKRLLSAFRANSPAAKEIYVNNASQGTSSVLGGQSATGLMNGFNVGTFRSANDRWFDGFMQELIMYNSDERTNRTAISTNINFFYSIY